jgi:DNA-binding YbaB/EbfC family protein
MIAAMNIQKMLQQVQQMQGQMQKTQAELGSKTFEATVAGGRVSVTANGHGDIQGLKISREVVDPADVEMLQDLVLSAIQQVQNMVKESQAAEMGKLTGGLGLPPGMGF